MKIYEKDFATKVEIERDPTPSEAADYERDVIEAEAEAQSAAQAVSDREAAKASALAKLEALGLTTEEAQAIAGI